MKNLLYYAALAIALAGCKKESLLLDNDNNTQKSTMKTRTSGDVQFCPEALLLCEQNGVLIFPTLNAFQKVVRILTKNTNNGLQTEIRKKRNLKFLFVLKPCLATLL